MKVGFCYNSAADRPISFRI